MNSYKTQVSYQKLIKKDHENQNPNIYKNKITFNFSYALFSSLKALSYQSSWPPFNLLFIMHIVKHDLSNACQSNCTYKNDKPNIMQKTWNKTTKHKHKWNGIQNNKQINTLGAKQKKVDSNPKTKRLQHNKNENKKDLLPTRDQISTWLVIHTILFWNKSLLHVGDTNTLVNLIQQKLLFQLKNCHN